MSTRHKTHHSRNIATHTSRILLLVCLWVLALPSLAAKNSELFTTRQLNGWSKKAFEEMKTKYELVESGPLFEQAQCLMRDLVEYARPIPEGTEWEIVVVNDQQANASSLPGGQLILYTGIESIARDRDEMAYVIATLISQVTLQQAKERMERTMRTSLMRALLGGRKDEPLIDIPPEDESDTFQASDRSAIELIARAGYDPSAAVRAIERLRDIHKMKASSEKRLSQARALAPDAVRSPRIPGCE